MVFSYVNQKGADSLKHILLCLKDQRLTDKGVSERTVPKVIKEINSVAAFQKIKGFPFVEICLD